MKDVHTPLMKLYYAAISGLGYPTFEGEEPDDTLDKLYVVINNVTSSDISTMNSTDVQAQVQVTINSWEVKYNNREALNEAADAILQAVKLQPGSEFDMSAYNMQMLNLRVITDRDPNYGKLAGRVYISRQIIFDQHIFIKD